MTAKQTPVTSSYMTHMFRSFHQTMPDPRFKYHIVHGEPTSPNEPLITLYHNTLFQLQGFKSTLQWRIGKDTMGAAAQLANGAHVPVRAGADDD